MTHTQVVRPGPFLQQLRYLKQRNPIDGLPVFFIGLAALGLGAIALRSTRRVAVLGLIIVLLGVAMTARWGPLDVLLSATPARFFRYPWRFWTLTGFGAALLTGAALEAVRRLLPRPAGMMAIATVGAAVLLTIGSRFVANGTSVLPAAGEARRIYEAVGRESRGEGVLLELPLLGKGSVQLEPEAMVGSTHHWLPLVGGFVGYIPPHRPLLEETIARLPARSAIENLVDMTHASWVLLHPPAEWAQPATRAALLEQPLLRTVFEDDGWVLARIERTPQHPEWFAAIAAGWRPNQSPLGTPVVELPPEQALAEVKLRDLPERLPAGSKVQLTVDVTNRGTAGWPATVAAIGEWALSARHPLRLDAPYTVQLVIDWRYIDTARGRGAPQLELFPLPHDVSPGDTLTLKLALRTPRMPGAYELAVGPLQIRGARFDSPGNRTFRTSITLE